MTHLAEGQRHVAVERAARDALVDVDLVSLADEEVALVRFRPAVRREEHLHARLVPEGGDVADVVERLGDPQRLAEVREVLTDETVLAQIERVHHVDRAEQI